MRCGQRPAPRRPRGNASTRTSPRLSPGAIDRVALALALLAEVVVGRVTAVEWRGAIVAKLSGCLAQR